MKKFFVTLTILSLLLSCFSFFSACTNKKLELIFEEIDYEGEIAYSIVGIKNVTTEFELEIPSTYNNRPVIAIGDNAFNGINQLTSVTIPDNILYIGLGVFCNCTSLANITVSKDNNKYKSIDGNLYDKDGVKIIQYAIGKNETSFSVPESVEVIWGDSFLNAFNLTDVIIPDSVIEIGGLTFAGCRSLQSITIGREVRSILIGAFYGCNSLTDVYFQGSEEEWDNIFIEGINNCLTEATIHFLV